MKHILLTGLLLCAYISGISQTITGAAALIAIDEMENSLSQVIEDAENAGNSLINNGAFQANTLLQNFKVTYKDVIGKTEVFLDQQSYNIFLGIKSATDKILRGATDFVSDIDNSVTNLHSVMVSIPGISKKPFISRNRIPVLVRNATIDEYEIVFTGSLLDSKSTFKVNGKKIQPSEITTKQLTYHLDGNDLTNALKKKRASLELSFRYGLFKKKAKFLYYTKVIPLEFAKVDLEVSVANYDTAKISRVETLPPTRTGGSNYRGKRKKSKNTFTIYPSKPDNEILTESVKLKTLENRHGYGADIVNKSSAAILIQQHARSEGKPFGGGGKVQSQVSFTELAITRNIGTNYIKSLPLIFNDPLIINLPKNTLAVKMITVTLYDGKKITLTTENNNKNFEVVYRPVDRTLIIQNIKL